MAEQGACPCVPTRKLALHAVLTLVLLLSTVAQGALLNVFFIALAPGDMKPYLWFIADFCVAVMFTLTMCRSYSHWKKMEGHNAWRRSLAGRAGSTKQQSIYRKYKFFLGFHSMGYISWIVYSAFLILKIVFIFKGELVNQLSPDSFLSPQVMKMAIALTALIFFLFVEGHYDAARHTMRALYIANIVKNYIFEIFDSINFLSLLFIEETTMTFSDTFENIIIAFGCITLILPSVCLYNVSNNDYGRDKVCVILSFIYTMLHLFLVNVPYMIVRIYLWVTMRQPVSIFLVKNVFQIILTLGEATFSFPEVRAAILRRLGIAVPEQTSNSSSQAGDEGSNARGRNQSDRDTEDVELLYTNKSVTKDNSQALPEHIV